MKNMRFLDTLAKALPDILAFAVLLIVVLALFGAKIPEGYMPLAYIAAIGAMLIFTLLRVLHWRKESEREKPDEKGVDLPDIPPAVETPPARPAMNLRLPFDEAKKKYLEAVVADFYPLSLPGLDVHSGDPAKARLPLADIYIDLNTTTQVEKKQRRPDRKEKGLTVPFDRQENRPLTALEALDQSHDRRMVLLGKPGTGKSTFVRYLALCMAQELCGESRKINNWTGKAALPVAVSLGHFAESLSKDVKKGSAELVEQYLVDNLLKMNDQMADFSLHLLSALEKEGGLILFDGLDEVADLNLRPVVVQAVEAFVKRYSRNTNSHFLVTCRYHSYQQDENWRLTDWPVYELDLFTPEQIEQFVTKWYEQHTLLEPRRAFEYAEKKKKLLAAVQPGERRRLHQVASYPIILAVMAIVHAHYELPDSRAEVYEQCVQLLLEKWEASRSIMGKTQTRSLLVELDVPASVIYPALYEIAYKAHKGNDKKVSLEEEGAGSLVTEGLILNVLHECLQDRKKEDTFLEYCQKANGLLMLRGKIKLAGVDAPRLVYAFPHLTFEEYLAGRYLRREDPEHARQLLDDAHDRWREAVKFLAEYLCFNKDPDRHAMNGLLEALSYPFPGRPKKEDWQALWLAGELLVFHRRVFKAKPFPYADDLVKNLRRLVKTNVFSPRERAAAADTLDELGCQPDDLSRFIHICSDDLSRPGKETTKVVTTKGFWIGKYPVTNAQYERFLKPENFTREGKKYWLDFPKFSEPDKNGKITEMAKWGEEGWEWLQRASKDEDYLSEDDVLYPRLWREPRFGIARRAAPVVGVSWYEANAYCKWLAGQKDSPELQALSSLGLPPSSFIVRLPTEAEWIAAAGGEENDRYPWDKGEPTKETEDVLRCANVYESGINRATLVWMYPAGASQPHGVMDMAGNVWEWQANYYDKDRDWLAWRGGSWSAHRGDARCAARSRYDPCGRLNYLGFRVVLAPHL